MGNRLGHETSTETVSEYVTDYPREMKTFIWTVNDFSNILRLDAENWKPKITFTAGESIEMQSKWSIKIQKIQPFDPNNDPSIAIYLRLEEFKGQLNASLTKETKVYASLKISFENQWGKGSACAKSEDMRNRMNYGFILKTAAALKNDVLKVKFDFTLYGQQVLNVSLPFQFSTLKRKSQDDLGKGLDFHRGDGSHSDFTIRVMTSATEYIDLKVSKWNRKI